MHLVDPFPAGGGRVWRDTQSGLLRLNTTTEDYRLRGREREMEGPVTPARPVRVVPHDGVELTDAGARRRGGGPGTDGLPDPAAGECVLRVSRTTGARRRAPELVEIITHAQPAVDLLPSAAGRREVVVLEDGQRLTADAVVLVNSHVDVRPAPAFAGLAAFADDHGLTYVPPGYGGDLDLDLVAAGEDIIVRGFGLGFIDLMILLTEGRGGRFVADGRPACATSPPALSRTARGLAARRAVPRQADVPVAGGEADDPEVLHHRAPSPRCWPRDPRSTSAPTCGR